MSIKKLFDSTEKNKNYLTEKNDKTAFEDVESSRNVDEIAKKHGYKVIRHVHQLFVKPIK